MANHISRTRFGVVLGIGLMSGCVSSYSFNGSQEASASPDSSANVPVGVPSSVAPVPLPSPSASPCTPQSAQNLRIMFMVDESASTLTDDPGAKIRTTAAMSFLNANLADANLTYSYSYFGPEVATYDFSNSSFSSNPIVSFGNGKEELAAATLFQGMSAGLKLKGTNYQNALAAVQAAVMEDNQANPGIYSYAVIFMSDGKPNEGIDSSSGIDGLVKDLVNTVGASRLSLSAVYFSVTPDSGDESIIDNMAISGGGQYVNGDSSNLNLNTMIQNIITVPPGSCNM